MGEASPDCGGIVYLAMNDHPRLSNDGALRLATLLSPSNIHRRRQTGAAIHLRDLYRAFASEQEDGTARDLSAAGYSRRIATGRPA